MDKRTLRSVLVGLNVGDQLSVVFRSNLSSPSGEYEVVNKRRGRGKGGSWLVDVKLANMGSLACETFTIGTSRNDDVVSVVVDGQFYGFKHENEMPANYETNTAQAVALKEQFKALLANIDETQPMVEVVAPSAPEVDGNFTVTAGRQLRGRAGQVVLTLQRDTGETVELWSYRHSGVVDRFTVVGP